jgi:hypothetical protein
MTNAKLIIKERRQQAEDSFVELSVFQVPAPVRGSVHTFKYRLAYVVRGVCVMRYDNEAGKGDHKHIGGQELPILFIDLPTLLRDFFADVKGMKK